MTIVYNILYNYYACIFIINNHVLRVIYVMWTVIIFLQNWEIIHKPVGEYPVGRNGHAATVISGCTQEMLVTIGGVGEDCNTLSECWVMNILGNKHKKVLYICYCDHLMIIWLTSTDFFHNTKFIHDLLVCLFFNVNTILRLLYKVWGAYIKLQSSNEFVHCLAN